MKVINVLVNDKLDMFLEQLIKTLIINEIGYVEVDGYEFHMMDNIYRFYSLSDIGKNKNIDFDKFIYVDSFLDTMTDKFLEKGFNTSEEYVINSTFYEEDSSNRKNNYLVNKKMIKRQNKMINQKIHSGARQYTYRRKTF